MIVVGTADGLVELALDGREIRRALPGYQVSAISRDWVIADGRVVSLRGGQPIELPAGLTGRCVLAGSGGRALVGTNKAHLLQVGNPGGPVADGAFEAIPGRERWSTPWGGPPDVRSIAAGPDGPIVGVHVGGVWRPEGDRWVEAVPVEADDHQVVASGKTVAVAAGAGVGQSEDGGRTWDWHDDGLHGPYCRAAALAEGWLIVSASSGPGAKRSALYRRPLDAPARPFVPCGDGLPQGFAHQIDTFELAAAGNVVALGTPVGELFVSQDSGATWARIADTLPGVRCVALNS
ncbi:MAG TPA: sialidase family protein [Acidimicrobiales bacterium]|nr:sialidase family protein [Acidimicrobiales bacterium]